jgi:hypothetical protein
MDPRDQLRLLPSWRAAVLVVLVALVTLALRAAALVVVLVANAGERVDVALANHYGIAPLGSLAVLMPLASTPPIWTGHPQ